MSARTTAMLAALLVATSLFAGFAPTGVGTADAQTAEFGGGITLDGSPAADGQTYEYDLNGTEDTSDADVTFEGVKNTERQNRSTTAESDTLDIDPRGTADPENATMRLTGQRETNAQSQTVSDGDSISIGGNTDPESESITIEGAGSLTDKSDSGSISDGSGGSLSVGGSVAPSNEQITLEASATTRTPTVSGTAPDTESINPSGTWSADSSVDVDLHNPQPESTTRTFGDFQEPNQWNVKGNESTRTFNINGDIDEFSITAESNDGYVAAIHPEIGDWTGDTRSFDKESTGDLQTETWDVSGVSASGSIDVTLVEENDEGKRILEATTRTEAPSSVDVDGDSVSPTGSTSVNVGSGGDVSISPDWGSVDYDISWSETDGIGDISVDLPGATVSHDGLLDGSVTKNPDLSTGSGISASYSGGSDTLDYDLSWTEDHRAHDPSVTIGGSAVSHSGALAEGETETGSVDLSTGSSTVSVDSTGSIGGATANWTEVNTSQNPSIELDDGTTLAEAGTLAEGETVEESVDLTTGTHTADISSDGPVEAEVVWDDVSKPVDPSVTVNGETVQHTGTLAEGQTVTETVSADLLQSGKNTVEVGAGDANGGPTALVGFDYAHDASSAEKQVNVSAETWQERFDATQTFSSDQQNATARMTFSENIVDVRDLSVTVNGEAYDAPKEDWQWDPDTPAVEVPIGDRTAGDEVIVSVVGSKVGVRNGEMSVTNPSTEGSEMDTRATVSPDGSGTFGVDVSGTVWDDRLHDVESAGWQDDGSYSEVRSDGTQIVHMPNAVDGEHVEVGVTDMSIDPSGGPVHADPLGGVGSDGDDDFAYDRVDLSFEGATAADVTYHNTTSGDVYGLQRASDDAVVDRAQASSPVTLTADSGGTYSIVPSSFDSAVAVGAPQQQSDGIPGPTWLWLLLAVGGVTLLLVDVVAPGGRITGGSTIGAITGAGARIINLIPGVNVGNSRSQTGRTLRSSGDGPNRATLIIAGIGMASVGLVAAELVTARSIFFELPQLLGSQLAGGLTGAIGGVIGTSFGPVLVGTLALLGLWMFDQLTDTPLDRWVQVVAVGGVVVYMVESIRPGTLLGPVSGAIETMLPVLILVAIFIGWRWWQARSQPDITVETGSGGD